MRHLIALLLSTTLAHAEPFHPHRALPDNSTDKPPTKAYTDDDVKSGRLFDTKDGDKCREVWVIGVRQWICVSQPGELTYPRSGWDRK